MVTSVVIFTFVIIDFSFVFVSQCYLAYVLDDKSIVRALKEMKAVSSIMSVNASYLGTSIHDKDVGYLRNVLLHESYLFLHDHWLVDPVDTYSIKALARTSYICVTRDDEGIITAFSHHSSSRSKFGTRTDFWFHGKCPKVTIRHIIEFLDHLKCKSFHGRTRSDIIISHPVCMEEKSVEESLLPYIGPRYDMKPTFTNTLGLLWTENV